MLQRTRLIGQAGTVRVWDINAAFTEDAQPAEPIFEKQLAKGRPCFQGYS